LSGSTLTQTHMNMPNKLSVSDTIGWLVGILVFAIGLVNTLWGNDTGFGIFLLLLSFVYFPPVNIFIKKKTDFSIPLLAKIGLALFTIWASLGVGELFDKIDLMLMDF
jgi:hypothetical protein